MKIGDFKLKKNFIWDYILRLFFQNWNYTPQDHLMWNKPMFVMVEEIFHIFDFTVHHLLTR